MGTRLLGIKPDRPWQWSTPILGVSQAQPASANDLKEELIEDVSVDHGNVLSLHTPKKAPQPVLAQLASHPWCCTVIPKHATPLLEYEATTMSQSRAAAPSTPLAARNQARVSIGPLLEYQADQGTTSSSLHSVEHQPHAMQHAGTHVKAEDSAAMLDGLCMLAAAAASTAVVHPTVTSTVGNSAANRQPAVAAELGYSNAGIRSGPGWLVGECTADSREGTLSNPTAAAEAAPIAAVLGAWSTGLRGPRQRCRGPHCYLRLALPVSRSATCAATGNDNQQGADYDCSHGEDLSSEYNTAASAAGAEGPEGPASEGMLGARRPSASTDCDRLNVPKARGKKLKMSVTRKRSLFKGVCAYPAKGLWRSQLSINCSIRQLGVFTTQIQAALQYRLAAPSKCTMAETLIQLGFPHLRDLLLKDGPTVSPASLPSFVERAAAKLGVSGQERQCMVELAQDLSCLDTRPQVDAVVQAANGVLRSA